MHAYSPIYWNEHVFFPHFVLLVLKGTDFTTGHTAVPDSLPFQLKL